MTQQKFTNWINSKTNSQLNKIFSDCNGITKESLEKLPLYCKENILFHNGVK